jgi:hypothetical protein
VTAESRGLVVVRLGRDHRIHHWLGLPQEGRSWDLALSLYDEVDLPAHQPAELIHRVVGGKWDGLSQFFTEFPEVIRQYDYFWLVDDDVEATVGEVNALFAYMRANDFDLAQPSLSLDSYYSHRLTLHCRGFSHRHTNFVELMAPMLSRHLLINALPLFANTRSGHGMDWMWQRLARDPGKGVAIIDAVTVRHSRPLRQHLAARLSAAGINSVSERERLVRDWAVQREHAYAFAGRLISGKRIDSRTRLAFQMLDSYWRARGQVGRPRWPLKNFLVFFLKHMFYRRIRG